jgi:uncharacterized membrane protein YkvA (DUF1232 family)
MLHDFSEIIRDAILSLPQDLKAALRVVDDPEIDDDGRRMTAGVLLHILSGANAMPGLRGVLAYLDDVLVLRIALERIQKRCPEAMETHRADAPELLEPLAEHLSVARTYLGNLMALLEKAVDGSPKLSHKGYSAEQCARDTDASNWLYDAVQAAIVERLEFDEDEVSREARHVDQILPQIKSRVSTKP